MTVKKTVRLDDAAAKMVANEAGRTGTSESDIMSTAIDDYLMRRACASLDRWSSNADHEALVERWRSEDAAE